MVKKVENLTDIYLTEGDDDIFLHFKGYLNGGDKQAGVRLSTLLTHGSIVNSAIKAWAREQLDRQMAEDLKEDVVSKFYDNIDISEDLAHQIDTIAVDAIKKTSEEKIWLECIVSPGQYSDEYTISGKLFDGISFSLFAEKADVEVHGIPTKDHSTRGWIRVIPGTSKDGLLLVRLPTPTFEHGQIITVRKDQIRYNKEERRRSEMEKLDYEKELKRLYELAIEQKDVGMALELLDRLMKYNTPEVKVRDADISQHKSDCAVHNEPAMPAGECDCQEEVEKS